MRVLKFGGTSVGSVANINQVINIVSNEAKQDRITVVVSALGGITDLLMQCGIQASTKEDYAPIFNEIEAKHLEFVKALVPDDSDAINEIQGLLDDLNSLLNGIYLINELSPKTVDKLLAYGEILSSSIIARAMYAKGLDAARKDSRDLITTNDKHTKAGVNYKVTNSQLEYYFAKAKQQITVLPGFIASSANGETTTLGRGGSDFTAAIVAAALDVDQVEIYTDVSGMYTANPKLVKQAKPIESISYHEAMELSHFGAKVLYPPTIVPVMSKNIPIRIKNTMAPEDAGTLIHNQEGVSENPIKGLSNISNIALLTLEGGGMVGIPGISKRLFETLSNQGINIILITQASSEHSICLGVMEEDAGKAKNAIDEEFEYEISLNKIDPLNLEIGLSIIALVGDQMKSHQGISGKMFSTLGKNNVNIRAIAQGASEKNISAVIAQKDVKKALNSLHERFFEAQRKQLNLFITGVGNVGEKLLNQINQQQDYLKKHLNINMRVLGLSNSRKMHIDENGIDLNNWKEALEGGESATLDGFHEAVVNQNQRNSIFVDITANADVADMYGKYLKQSVAVVACNKIAASSDYAKYSELKRLSKAYNAPLLFETNVGAGLPIIDTLNNLIASGDRVNRIQAVLSGSLNFVFNNFKSGESFHDVVQAAKAEGFTEPDPRIDLSGVDVARKILILARESGLKINLEDITNEPFLTDKNLNSSDVPHFFETLKEDAAHFEKLVADAEAKNHRLKYVAQLDNGKASVGLQSVPEGHPFYDLKGSDNIVLFFTDRYPEQPMQIKGAGAGGDVTASGLFADIIRTATF
ncbi:MULTISPECIES: bifunctional aspartate kinase/homoserine dehydrogenase I [unclassified Leeuwenhoekiella]|uniref:bifunctional aspartate kinase/homoserine dehydrogenase I n=1 Tax=unclassified Leeuwenhoekiella TaxID=2615029 RepID=UPI000C498FDC|nr:MULTISPECIES: bifunctional aspartate kinase/homoserine dehydrogenase I [unclassified Leeuwenhoekiella]MBA79665.1 bifunctional aspartate kinase/homoserine dehydrogenase I [Leeuwenhoekiella sp.]|tara:strand:+ start:42053 stop:44491 length:2439 start_codon:yes stop_codon:yes gene_type:complete